MRELEVPACHADVCITCSDQGIPLQVETVDESGLAVCEGGDEIDVTLVSPVAAGDTVLAHAGVAIAKLERVR
jgi:hydrogenase maturation factor